MPSTPIDFPHFVFRPLPVCVPFFQHPLLSFQKGKEERELERNEASTRKAGRKNEKGKEELEVDVKGRKWLQAEEVGKLADSMGAKAEEVEARISSEQRFQQLHARLLEAADLAAQKTQVGSSVKARQIDMTKGFLSLPPACHLHCVTFPAGAPLEHPPAFCVLSLSSFLA